MPYYEEITEEQARLIHESKIFFVASAEPSLSNGPNDIGPVNLSPKGDALIHILSPSRVAYLDYEGSGNETARHAKAGGYMTIMFCSFGEENAAIVRLYGKGKYIPVDEFTLSEQFLNDSEIGGILPVRGFIQMDVEKTATSCGYGVPVMKFLCHRKRTNRGRLFKRGGKKINSRS